MPPPSARPAQWHLASAAASALAARALSRCRFAASRAATQTGSGVSSPSLPPLSRLAVQRAEDVASVSHSGASLLRPQLLPSTLDCLRRTLERLVGQSSGQLTPSPEISGSEPNSLLHVSSWQHNARQRTSGDPAGRSERFSDRRNDQTRRVWLP